MKRIIRVGLLDSGVSSTLGGAVVARQAFTLTPDGEVIAGPSQDDEHGHGTALAQIITSQAPAAHILSAQVFRGARSSTAAVIATGLRWLVSEDADLINMSFGFRRDRRGLRDACQAAQHAGCILVGAAPARGPEVYPSAYDGVVRVTGDARCHPGQVSHLATSQAEFGACPRTTELTTPSPQTGGASFATAYVTGILAAFLAEGPDDLPCVEYLERIAVYQGPERRASGLMRPASPKSKVESGRHSPTSTVQRPKSTNNDSDE